DRPMSVLQPTLVQSVSLPILDSCPGVLLMNVQCDVFHIALPPSPVSLPTDIAKYIAFILIRMTLRYSRLSGEISHELYNFLKAQSSSFSARRLDPACHRSWKSDGGNACYPRASKVQTRGCGFRRSGYLYRLGRERH